MNRVHARKLFIAPIAAIIIFYCVIGLTNYAIDPDYLFDINGKEKNIAKILASNKAITNIDDYDERIANKLYIDALTSNLDVVIIGSSRIKSMRSQLFNGKKVFNNSVSGASLQDIIATIQIYYNKGCLPKRVIIGIDPWIFNNDNGDTRWESISTEYFTGIKALGLTRENKTSVPAPKAFRWDKLFSYGYFKRSLRKLYSPEKFTILPTEIFFQQNATLLPDGTVVYEEKERNVPKYLVEKSANEYTIGDAYHLKNFTRLDPKLQEEFEGTIHRLIDSGIDVDLFLIPYHPTVYNSLKQKNTYPAFFNVEPYILNFADKADVAVYGSIDPIQCGVGGEAFIDGMHPKEQTIRLLFEAGPVNMR